MDTFLETQGSRSRTFLLYGNLNDSIWCGDLAEYSSGEYLVRLLKSRGYRHVLFYGDAGTRGAYCLDPESARFFFRRDNRDLPLPAPAEGTAPQGEGPKQGGRTGTRLDGLVSRRPKRGYRPGDPAGRAPQEDRTAPAEPVRQEPAGPARVRYALRGMELGSLLLLIDPLMKDPESHMAVVFYNLFTTSLGSAPALRDNILTGWEQCAAGNLCLLLAPETMYSTAALMDYLRDAGLATKFVRGGESGPSLNPMTCIEVGYPREDEIQALLRRLRLVGTPRGRKLAFPLRELERLSAEILFCSRSCDVRERGGPAGSAEYMRQICHRLQRFADSRPGGEAVPLTLDAVDGIWDRPPRSRKPALEELRRPGWEAAYAAVKEAVEHSQAYRRQHSAPVRAERADWAVGRLRSRPPADGARPPAPSFALLGGPGVGKSTIAEKIGQVLREYGVLKVGSVVKVTRENLTSSYVAGVPRATMNCVNRAEEGVLFIDEAHALGIRDSGAGHEGTGREVISTLNSAMTDPNRHFCVVLAGHRQEMEAVWNLEPGFKSRFGEEHIITLEDYPPELLERILVQKIQESGCRLDEALTQERALHGAARPLSCMVRRLYQERDRRTFGNAREMEALALQACGRAEDGLVTESCFYNSRISGAWFAPSDTARSTEEVLRELRGELAGLDQLEDFFSKKALEIEEALASGGSEEDVSLRPLLLVGQPGTGKTTAARLLSRLYYHFHLLGTPELIEVSGSALASSLAGGTQEKVLSYVREAQDRKGMLFVDEAHSLASGHFDGAGAVQAFLNPLTDRAHPFQAVFAVYPSRLQEFLELDPGLKSRFEILTLEPYTGPQLYAILLRMMARNRPPLTASPEAGALLRRVCDYLYAARTEESGNARQMENLLRQMNDRRRARCHGAGIPPADPARGVLLPEDVPLELAEKLPPEQAGPEQILARLNQLCGLEEVKRDVRTLFNKARMDQLRRERGLPVERASLHMVFLGSPGTGKTTVARLIGQMYQALGLLPRAEVTEVSRSDLVAGYIGQTALKTQEVIRRAMGGVLFVDEAYTLTGAAVNDFGQEAVDTLLKAMEDHRDSLVVIAAGYTEPMKRFLASNPGLDSRFGRRFTFQDYSLDQLMDILDAFCRSGAYHLTGEARAAARRAAQEELLRHRENFGNARYIRNLFEAACRRQADRLAPLPAPTGEELSTLTQEDLDAAAQETRG